MDEHTSHPIPTDTTATHTREEMTFRSGDAACAATLYRPATAAHSDLPCVVLAVGFSQTRRDGYPRFAEQFAQAGFAALVFDYRHLGDSEGEPRQLIDFQRQRADLAAAISFARTLDGIDPNRVAVWAFSFGGGHAVHEAARDDRLAAAITLSPFVDGLAFTLTSDGSNSLRLIREAAHAALTRRPIRMPVFGPPGQLAVFTQPEARSGLEAVRAQDSLWRNEVLIKASQPAVRIRPVRAAHRVRCPLLVGLGSHHTMLPAGPMVRLAERAPRGELRHYPGGHFDGFLDHFEEIADDHIEFLTRHLMAPHPAR